MRDVPHPDQFRADDRRAAGDRASIASAPTRSSRRYEFNFHLPAAIAAGGHHVRIALGRREFAPLGIEVV